MALSPDDYAKQLHHRLIESGIELGELRSRSWFDFLNFDCQKLGADPVVIAAEAFLYLSLDGHAFDFSFGLKVLQAVVAFLRKQTGAMPAAEQLMILKDLLSKNPVDNQLVVDWFDEHYP